MRILAGLLLLMVLVGACNSEGEGRGGRAGSSSTASPPGEQIPGGIGFDLGFSARAERDDAVDQPWRVPCIVGPLPADEQRRAARGLTQDVTRYDAMLWTKRTFAVYPTASVARQAVHQLTV